MVRIFPLAPVFPIAQIIGRIRNASLRRKYTLYGPKDYVCAETVWKAKSAFVLCTQCRNLTYYRFTVLPRCEKRLYRCVPRSECISRVFVRGISKPFNSTNTYFAYFYIEDRAYVLTSEYNEVRSKLNPQRFSLRQRREYLEQREEWLNTMQVVGIPPLICGSYSWGWYTDQAERQFLRWRKEH